MPLESEGVWDEPKGRLWLKKRQMTTAKTLSVGISRRIDLAWVAVSGVLDG
jgi:hypothetical protein